MTEAGFKVDPRPFADPYAPVEIPKCIVCDEYATRTNGTLCETHWNDAEVENLDDNWDEL